MTDASPSATGTIRQRRPRAWWQWVLGVGLLVVAAVLLTVRLFPGLAQVDIARLGGIERRKITPPADFKEVDRVPADHGEFAGNNLLIVTFDTTRADRIGCYGNDNIRTPNVDRLAREGLMFVNASAAAPVTLPAHSSIMTGLYTYHHGARANGFFTLDDGNTTLAEVLSDAGYATGAAVSAFVLESRYGINQGFVDYYDDLEEDPDRWPRMPDRPANKTTDEAIRWLEGHADSKFFYWVHYYDPHQPYEAPKEYEQPSKLEYDAEIAFADSQLGRILDLLDERGLADKTLVVVVGDHGEGLYNHDEPTHGFLLYETTLHVPLVMRCGTKLGGKTLLTEPVSQVDIMPTVLSMLGVACPENVDGVDLTRPVDSSRAIYFETLEGLVDHGCSPLIGVRKGSTKYLYFPRSPELYDVSKDPFEGTDLASSRPDEDKSMHDLLTRFYGDDLEAAMMPTQVRMPTAEEMAQLKALGYAQGVEFEQRPIAELTDPREIGKLSARISEIRREDLSERIEDLEELAREYPDSPMVHMYRIHAYLEKEQWDQAEAAAEKLIEIKPNNAPTLMQLARLKTKRGDYKGATELLAIAMKQPSHQYEVRKQYGETLFYMKRFSEATDRLIEAYRLDPTDENLPDMIVQAATPVHRLHDTEIVLREELDKRANLPMTRSALAQILIGRGEWSEAIELLREGRKLQPTHLGLANNLAYVLATCTDASLAQPKEATAVIEDVCKRTGYKNPKFLHTLSLVYFTQNRADEAIEVANRALEFAKKSEDETVKALVPSIETSLAAYKKAKRDGMDSMPAMRTPTSGPVGAKERS